MGAFLGMFVWWALALASPKSDIAQPPTIVLVSTPEGADKAWPDAQSRLQAELLAAGFRVVLLPRLADSDLAAEARANGAVAIVRAQRDSSHGRVDVWLAQPDSGRSNHYVVEREGATSRAVADELALQTVERLHASFIELPPRPAVASTKPAPEPTLVRQAPTRGREVGVDVKARFVAAGSPGGMGLLLGGGLGTTVFVWPRIGIDLDAYVVAATEPLSLAASASTALARQAAARLHFVWRPVPSGPISPTLGAGMGILVPWAVWRAAPEADLDEQSKVGLVALPSVRAGLAARLNQQLALELAIQIGYATSEVVIYDELGNSMASAGQPLIDGGIALVWSPARSRR